jgi:hypothetical protein
MLRFTRQHVGSIDRWAILGRGLALVLLAALAAPTAHAQVLYGSLAGNVTDSTGAVVVGATVRALNVGTNVTRASTTDARGAYLFSDLIPGDYEVTIESAGFNSHTRKGVRVDSNSVRRVDAKLDISGVSETIEITAASAPLQTDRADVHVTQTERQVNDLPLSGSLGRNYQSLMQVVPGSVIVRTENGQGEANSQAGSPQRSISFSANGVSGWQNQTRIDGSPVQYTWLPTNTSYVPSAEAIQEVSIVTNSYNAEQGMAGGAAINVVVKSGTNDYRGTAWGYDTNSALRARNVFQTTPSNPRNIVAQFGGNLGGPIMRDKLFFFANAERSTQRVAAGSSLQSIAPANLRPNGAGDVVFPLPSQGGAIIYDPASNPDPAQRTPFPNNTIPRNRIDPAALYLIERLPATTGPGYVNNVLTQGATEYNRTNYDAKLNYVGTRFNLFARYGNSPHLIDDAYSLGEAGGNAAGGGQVGRAPGRTHVVGVGTTYVFSPTLLLDANIGYTYQKLGAEAPDIEENIGSDPDKMNIPGTNGPDRLQGGLPGFQFNNTFSNLGNTNTGNPFQFRDKTYSATVNLQKAMSSHVFRGGLEYLDQQIHHFQPQGGAFQTVRGTFQFNGQSTMLQNAPAPADARFNSWASFLLGLPSGAGKVEQLTNPNSILMKTYSAYVQDTWQVNRNLTLALGLRWELQAWPTRPDGKGVNRFDPADGFVYIGGYGDVPQDTGASAGSGKLLPRAGLTYRFGEKTVFRAGYAMSVDPSTFINFRDSYPTVFIWAMPPVRLNGVDNPFIPVTNLRQGLIAPAGAPDLNAGRIPLPRGVGTNTYAKEIDRGDVHSFNVTVQRELASWLTAQAAYVGTRALGQMSYVNVNAGAPGTGDAGRPLVLNGLTNVTGNINVFSPYGDTIYNGLQTQVMARSAYAQGGVTYTLSKTTNYVDNAGGNAAGAGGPRIQYLPEKERNKGLAGYDRTHNLQAFGVWDLPFGKGRRWANGGGFSSGLLGGWQFNGIVSVMSGTPIYIVQNTGFNLNAAGSQQIPDLVGNLTTFPDNQVNRPPAGADPNQYQYFDRSAFQAVNIPAGQAQRFGNSPRNELRGPGFWNVDLGLFKNVYFPGGVRMQLRFEALNALNHPNFSNPGNNISDAGTFGFITSTTGNYGERNIRLGVRVTF